MLSIHAKELWILPRNLFLDSLMVSQTHVFFPLLVTALNLSVSIWIIFSLYVPINIGNTSTFHTYWYSSNSLEFACLEFCKTDSCGHRHTLNIILQNLTGSSYNRSHTHTQLSFVPGTSPWLQTKESASLCECVCECVLLLRRQRLLFTVLVRSQPMRTTNHWSVSEVRLIRPMLMSC